ncbi:EamA-like transporter family protein [Cohaesibacter sp. ES.047]|uniref:DMT family transporter n=1 Tax=Cohaesibacter sp. ES.047 TaxID=1798205 RepID=UPI000BC09591|nr:DMT family transporter [Cohaesibacter sp. ES.047]SNY90540.1 EamA-like transporter family protein [Cohaesibacter sp. ES.047]
MMTSEQSEHMGVFSEDGPALFLSAMAAVFWGSVFEATRLVLVDLTPWTAVATRFVFAAAATLIWLWLSGGINWPIFRRNFVAFLMLGAFGIAGFSGLLFWGMKSSSPVTAALIMATNPLITNLIDAFMKRRKPKMAELAGLFISMLGVALTVGAFSGARLAPGDLLILLASLVWAFYSLGSRNWVKGASPLQTSVWTTVFGTVFLVIAAVVLADPVAELQMASVVTWAATVWMALVGSVLAYLFWQIGIAVRGPAATSVLYNLVPVSALIIAACFGRMPDGVQILGVFVAIFGVLLASGRVPFLSR